MKDDFDPGTLEMFDVPAERTVRKREKMGRPKDQGTLGLPFIFSETSMTYMALWQKENLTVEPGVLDGDYMTRLHARVKSAVDSCGPFKRSECVYVMATIIAVMTAHIPDTNTPEKAQTFGDFMGKQITDRISSLQQAMLKEEADQSVKH